MQKLSLIVQRLIGHWSVTMSIKEKQFQWSQSWLVSCKQNSVAGRAICSHKLYGSEV